jgi:hypothetical protein
MTYIVVEYHKKHFAKVELSKVVYTPHVMEKCRAGKARTHTRVSRPMFRQGDRNIAFTKIEDAFFLKDLPITIWHSDDRYSQVPDIQIDRVKERAAQSLIEPETRKVFRKGDIVESLDWLYQGREYRVVRSNLEITDLRDVESGVLVKGHLTQNLVLLGFGETIT